MRLGDFRIDATTKPNVELAEGVFTGGVDWFTGGGVLQRDR